MERERRSARFDLDNERRVDVMLLVNRLRGTVGCMVVE